MTSYLPIAIAVISFTLYNVFQKSIAPNANPYLSLVVTYLIGGVTSVIAYYITKAGSISLFQEFRQVNWAAYLLGFAVFGIEVGFLFAYRNGWNISIASLLANVLVALILIPVGLFFFREHIIPVNYIGIILCIGGLILVARQ